MKQLQRICSAGLLWLIGLVLAPVQAQSYDSLWQQMEQAREKGLPKTMIQVADRIIRKAEREQNAPQLLKATVWGEYVQSRLTPDSIYAGIRHLEAWADCETNPVHRSILYSILAERYQDEMWKSGRTGQERTELDVEEAPMDMREWSRNLFVDKVDACLQASLKEEKALLEVSAKEYQPFTILGDGSQFYQHDLYHLLASRALKTYEQIENSLPDTLPDTLPSQRVLGLRRHMGQVYANRPGAEPAALLTALDWIKLERDEAVRLAPYQEYLTVQQTAGNRYLQRLDSLIARYGAEEVCAEAYICKASWLKNVSNGSLLDCLNTCDEGLKRYPRYPRIAELKNIREEVEQPLLSGRLPGPAYPGDTLKLAVEHRNLSGFTWNLYRTSLTRIPNLDGPITAAYIQKQGRKIGFSHVELVPTPKAGRSLSEWRYLRSDTLVRVPVPDEIGVYILQLVPDNRKSPMEAQFFVQSRLRPLTLEVNPEQTEILVVDAQSGHPLEGVEIKGYDRWYAYPQEKVLQTLVTNAEGKAMFTGEGIQSYTVRKGNDAALPRQSLNVRVRYGHEVVGQDTKHLTLLTDRSLYRPGQTVYVKGVAYRQQGWEAEVLKQADYELVLLDANRQEIASKKLCTNDFGSFTAEFSLPSSCLNGMFTLCTRDRRSAVRIQVEEYKRPTFEIQFTPLSEGYCLGEEVVLKGTVKAFNGRSVQYLPLAYTLEYNSWNRRHVSSVETLQHDTVLLDVQGHFEIPVKLRREGVNHLDNMEYILRAVVTDEAGETQTADYRFRAMDQRYLISVGLPSVLCKEDSLRTRVHVSNAAMVPQSVTGTAALYRKADWKQLQTDSRTTAVKPVWKGTFQANEQTDFSAWSQLPSGEYCLQLTVRDSLGREQTYPAPAGSGNPGRGEISFLLYSKQDTRLPVFRDLFYQAEEETFDARQPAVWYLGTSHRDVHLMMDVFKGHDRVSSRSFQLTDTLMRMELPYQEAYGEGVSVLFTFVKRGQVYSTWQILKKKQPQTTLDMKWTVFRDRLRPGQPEEWQLTVKRPDGLPADAEMLALLYDASLDQFQPHRQSLLVDRSPSFHAHRWSPSDEQWMHFRFHFPYGNHSVPRWKYDSFFVPFGITEVLEITNDALDQPVMVGAARPLYKSSVRSVEETGTAVEVKYVPVAVEEEMPENQQVYDVVFEEEVVSIGAQEVLEDPLAEIRQNFAETAFFYPQLRTNAQGDIVLSFTMPESLTRWNFRGYAHTQDMMTGQLEANVVTAKEFMVQPNLPRFLRVGDHTQLSATVTNLTEKAVKGTVRLTLFDPLTDQVVLTRKQKFSVEKGRNAAVTFPVEVDGRYSLLGVRLMAEGGDFSDGEQQLLPVLTDRIFLTETLPITVRGGEQKDCSLDKLFNGQSPTVTDRRLTVEFTGNPAWYAIQALPSLSVSASQSATDYATALYANALAGYLAASQPRIQAVITQWRQSGGTEETFRSQLEKNQELKQILLNESPWVLEAETEAEQRARIATLFDLNQLKDRRYAALTRLKELQLPEGAWSWYKGMGPSPLMTVYITELLVRLPLLTDQLLEGDAKLLLQKAFGYLHQQALKEYQEVKKAERKGAKFTEPSFMALQYLYLVALSGETVPKANQKVQAYWLDKVAGLLEDGSVTQKAQATVILWKAGRKKQAQDFAASLREHLILEEESGAHFAFLDEAYRWGMMPVPVHVAAMEALRLVGTEEALLEEMKIWLLKQKQTTAWNSPVATADAVYAMLMGGRNPLEGAGEVRITLGNHTLSTTEASATWAGLNYVKETFTEGHAEVTAPQISVHNTGEGMAWGAVYAQYLAPMKEVQSQGGALSVQKQLFVERMDATGHKTLQPVGKGAELQVGDVVVSRLTVSLDRAMDFVQLKDARGACFEPMTAHSGYRWLSGCGAYVEVEDAATNFFFDHLGKGVYVLENRCRLARRGTYQAGIATVQSAYAPEFSAHSAGMTVTVP